MRLIDILLKEQKKMSPYFENPLRYARIIKKIAKKILADGDIYLFGSAMKGNLRADSDIDILIVSPSVNPKLDNLIRVEIYKKFGPVEPFEIHIVTPEVYEGWYKNFIKKDYIVV